MTSSSNATAEIFRSFGHSLCIEFIFYGGSISQCVRRRLDGNLPDSITERLPNYFDSRGYYVHKPNRCEGPRYSNRNCPALPSPAVRIRGGLAIKRRTAPRINKQ